MFIISSFNTRVSVFILLQEVKPNHYISPSELTPDITLPATMPNGTLNDKYYSTGSLQRSNYKDANKMTVKEATLKRDSLLRANNTMRTNLMLQTNDYWRVFILRCGARVGGRCSLAKDK